MTHQELLDKLAYTPHTDPNGKYMYRALRAVVELHKPENRRGDKPFCSVCYTEGQPYEIADDVYYPCPTIQAIEKELE
jgi:hypothetical protein